MSDCPDCQARDLKALKLARSFEAVTKGTDQLQLAYAAAMHQAGARVRAELLGDESRQRMLADADRERRKVDAAMLSDGVRYVAPDPIDAGFSRAMGDDPGVVDGPEEWFKR